MAEVVWTIVIVMALVVLLVFGLDVVRHLIEDRRP